MLKDKWNWKRIEGVYGEKGFRVGLGCRGFCRFNTSTELYQWLIRRRLHVELILMVVTIRATRVGPPE
jgi:hypothetical protein